jgi:hypothetical protein
MTSSTTTTASPGLAVSTSQRRAPCSFAFRTENHDTGCGVLALWNATAAAIGPAPMVGPPIATASAGRRAWTRAPISGSAAGCVVVSEHSM